MRRYWEHGTFVNKDDSQQTSYYDPFQLIRILKRKITPSRILFILNVFAIVVVQLAIALGLTALITQIPQVSIWTLLNNIILYVVTAIYFTLEFIWAFIQKVSTAFPWNIIYLMIMIALLIAGAIGFPSTCYLLAKEVKWLFGQGTRYYPEDNIVKPARNIYGYCWSLFLTVMWIYAPFGMRGDPPKHHV
ncbi:unnamed protein product [Trichobilharzia szidati]|nr:unnamed protein product [Trichobilharzia szidati]